MNMNALTAVAHQLTKSCWWPGCTFAAHRDRDGLSISARRDATAAGSRDTTAAQRVPENATATDVVNAARACVHGIDQLQQRNVQECVNV